MADQWDKHEAALQKGIEDFIRKKEISIPTFLVVAGYLGYRNYEKLLPLIPLESLLSTAKFYLGWVLALLAFLLILLLVRSVWSYRYNKKHFSYLQILPHADDEIKPETLAELMRKVHGSKRNQWRRLLYGKEWFTFLIHYRENEKRGKNQYVFYVGGPGEKIRSVKHHISSLYAKAEFFPADQIEFPGRAAASGRMTTVRGGDESALSLTRYKKDQLPGILNVMKPGTWVQVNFSADSEYRMKKRITKAEAKVKKGKGYRDRNAFDREEENSYKKRFYGNEVSFMVTLSIASDSKVVAKETSTAIESVMHDVNELKFVWFRQSPLPAVQRFPLTFPYRMVWTGSELGTLFHLPDLSGTGIAEKVAKEIPHGTKGMQEIPKNVLARPDGFSFGELVHPLIDGRDVRLLPKALSKHWSLTGIVGSGKSTVLNTLFKSFIELSFTASITPGFSFIDPKKETATITLNQLLKRELEGEEIKWDKVKWISFKGADNPPAMNLLYKMEGVPDNVLTDQIMRIIKENNFGDAPQAERLLKKCIQTLLADEKEVHTILGIKPLLLREKFRRGVLARLKKDPKHIDLVQFWEDEADGLIDTSGNAILNRIDIFYSNDFLRRIFGQKGFNFPLKKWMDEGYMIFYDFNGMGEEEMGLIGSYLSYLYYRVADTRPDGSLIHQFVIDEAQRVKASIFPAIIQEMRSKGLSLGIATQTVDNLDKDLTDDLLNIAGNMFVCKQGKGGAEMASKAFRTPQADGKDISLFSPGLLMNLPERTCVIKTEDNGETVFVVVEVPPLDRYLPDGTKVTYGNFKETEASNKWTYAKAKELESKNGLPTEEIDKEIQAYLSEEAAPPVDLIEKPKAKPKNLVADIPDKVVAKKGFSLMDELEETTNG